jgi:DNA-directed RNA polymerase
MDEALTKEKLTLDSVIQDQVDLELLAIQKGVARYRRLAREAVDRGEAAGLKPVERLMVWWMEPMAARVRQERREIRKGKPGKGRAHAGPALLALDTDRLVVCTLHEMLGRCLASPSGDLVVNLAYSIGSSIIAELHHDMLRKSDSASLKDLDRRFKKLSTSRVNWWAKRTLDDHLWNRKVCTHIGVTMMWMAIESCSSQDYNLGFKLAFKHERQWRDNQKKGVVRLAPEIFELVEDGHLARQNLRPRYSPMVVTPSLWCSKYEGGYMRIKTPLVSKITREQEAAVKVSGEGCQQVYDALNYVNSTAWTINRKVLEVVEKLWDEGGGVAGLPGRENHIMPEKPADISSNAASLKAWKAKAHEVHTANNKLAGARIETAQKIWSAREFVDRGKFYMPHQLDFRTRLYPIPVYLNHHGDDLSRSLLMFDKEVEPGSRGMFWHRVQAASFWGLDKESLTKRNEWYATHRLLIERSAENPCDHTWWMDADEPWQFLASCLALTYPEYAARVPIQSDGTCNGKQHLAALGRDQDGAKSVNMMPSEAHDPREDNYADVSDCLHKVIAEDASSKPQAKVASKYLGSRKDRRSVCKQPSMTWVYGVTPVGARNQVKGVLKDLGVPGESLFKVSDYVSKAVLQANADSCPAGKAIFDWLEESSRRMMKAAPYEPVSWTTPLGFPVIQPYRNMTKCVVNTVMQRVTLAYRQDDHPCLVGRQVAGVVPNYVHSLDASHLMLVAMACKRMDVDFAAVHDSFWTHAGDFDRLQGAIRRSFIELHREDLLQKLFQEWSIQFPGLLDPPPEKGSYDINQVLASSYFFSP